MNKKLKQVSFRWLEMLTISRKTCGYLCKTDIGDEYQYIMKYETFIEPRTLNLNNFT